MAAADRPVVRMHELRHAPRGVVCLVCEQANLGAGFNDPCPGPGLPTGGLRGAQDREFAASLVKAPAELPTTGEAREAYQEILRQRDQSRRRTDEMTSAWVAANERLADVRRMLESVGRDRDALREECKELRWQLRDAFLELVAVRLEMEKVVGQLIDQVRP